MNRSTNNWQPEPGQWLVFRTDTQVQTQAVDIYVMLQIPSLYCYGFFLVEEIEPDEKDVKQLLQKAFKKDGSWARRLTLPKSDPAESIFRKFAEPNKVNVDTQPMALLEPFARPFKEDFGKFSFSPSGMMGSNLRDDVPPEDRESAEASIPDSYDPCPCASGKKYKFCCKRIFREVVMAMCAAEEGRHEEALKWMKKAQEIVGKTGEVLCRYAIVYSHFDQEKSDEYLQKCITLFPAYPRAYYIRGIELKEQGDHQGALFHYQKAIENYLPTDKYHLNEVWNNVGTVHYDKGQHVEAKLAWEKALVYLPSDRVVKDNLKEFIYTNPAIPDSLRKPSAFVAHFMEARERKHESRHGGSMANIIAMAQIATPCINDVLTQFLENQSKRLAPKTIRKYEEVIGLLQLHLDNYGYDGLRAAERTLFEKHYNAEGDAHRNYCDLFGPEKIFDTIGSFFGYFMIRKVMAGEELKRASGTVVKKLSQWLVENGFISEEAATKGTEEGSEAATLLPIAEKASRILFEHVDSKGLYPNDFEDDDDYIEFDHMTVAKLEQGKLWLEYHDIGQDKTIGPISVPPSATKLLKEGWDISCGLGRKRGNWHIIEMGNVYPN